MRVSAPDLSEGSGSRFVQSLLLILVVGKPIAVVL
jgi:hypothetical protein